MIRYVALAAGLVGCADPKDAGTGGVDPWSLAALGVSGADGTPIEDGAELHFDRGSQSGYHTELGAWVRIEVPEIWLEVAVYDADDGSLIASTPSAVAIALADFDEACEGWASTRTLLGTGQGTAEDDALACAVPGREVTVVVTVGSLDLERETEVTLDGTIDLEPPSISCDSR